MDIATTATIIGTAIGVLGFIYAFLRNFKNDINEHIDRIDRNWEKTNDRLDGHAKRLDQLYVAILDILKDRKS